MCGHISCNDFLKKIAKKNVFGLFIANLDAFLAYFDGFSICYAYLWKMNKGWKNLKVFYSVKYLYYDLCKVLAISDRSCCSGEA